MNRIGIYFPYVWCSIFSLIFLNNVEVLGHGDLHTRIDELTTKIQQHPDDLELYAQRGFLRLEHEEYQLAASDFRRCWKSEWQDDRLTYAAALTDFYLGRFKRSTRKLALVKGPDFQQNRLKLLGKINYARGRYRQAATDWEVAMRLCLNPRPDDFLNIAKAWEAADQPDQVVAILKDGISRWGYLPAFCQALDKSYRNQGKLRQAIDLQSKIILQSNRKEFALFRRAELYSKLEAWQEANEDLQKVTSIIGELKDHQRSRVALQRLIQMSNQLQIEVSKHY